MARARVTARLTTLHAMLDDLMADQVPFAAAVALTRTAQSAARRTIAALPQRFNVRSKRVTTAIKSVRASKRDWPHLTAKVGVLDKWLARHELGGTQKPDRGAHFAVPTSAITRRRTSTGAIRKGDKPRGLGAKGQAFREQLDLKATAKAKRFVAGYRLYLLRKSVRLRPRLGLRDDADIAANIELQKHFELEIRAAVLSRRANTKRMSTDEGRFFYLKSRKQLLA